MPLFLNLCLATAGLSLEYRLWEQPCVLGRLADCSFISTKCRRYCLEQLFSRYVRPGMKLSELARLSHKPGWIRAEHVWILDSPRRAAERMLGGGPPFPLRTTPEDTFIAIRVFCEPGYPGDFIFLRISGEVDLKTFLKVISADERVPARGAAIMESVYKPGECIVITRPQPPEIP